MEHILILVAELGAAVGVVYALFTFLFRGSFKEMVTPLKDSIDLLSFNVNQQTKSLEQQVTKLEQLENRVTDHETRLKIVEHDSEKEHK